MLKIPKGEAEPTGAESPSQLIDARIQALGDWRGETLARVRALIREADPEVVEERDRASWGSEGCRDRDGLGCL